MHISNIKDYKGGWFIGEFTPNAFVANFEVCYKQHPKGEKWPAHYHALATEINCLIDGLMTIEVWKFGETERKKTTIYPGQIFVVEPYEVIKPIFIENCSLIVVKSISDINDKYEV